MKFLTITLNPALDKTYYINGISYGEVNKVTSIVEESGGKGINVSKVISVLGRKNSAICVLGGIAGKKIEKNLKNYDIDLLKINSCNETRTNISLVDTKTKKITEINEQGVVSENIEEKVIQYIKDYSDKQTVVVICGSLPKNIDVELYKKIIKIAKENDSIVAVDVNGLLLKDLISLKPNLIKPNLSEIKELLNIETNIEQEISSFVKNSGVDVLLTMDKDGACYFEKEKITYSKSFEVNEVKTKGAGDTFLGAFLWAKYDQQYDIKVSMDIASSAAATIISTNNHYPTKEELLSFKR